MYCFLLCLMKYGASTSPWNVCSLARSSRSFSSASPLHHATFANLMNTRAGTLVHSYASSKLIHIPLRLRLNRRLRISTTALLALTRRCRLLLTRRLITVLVLYKTGQSVRCPLTRKRKLQQLTVLTLARRSLGFWLRLTTLYSALLRVRIVTAVVPTTAGGALLARDELSAHHGPFVARILAGFEVRRFGYFGPVDLRCSPSVSRVVRERGPGGCRKSLLRPSCARTRRRGARAHGR